MKIGLNGGVKIGEIFTVFFLCAMGGILYSNKNSAHVEADGAIGVLAPSTPLAPIVERMEEGISLAIAPKENPIIDNTPTALPSPIDIPSVSPGALRSDALTPSSTSTAIPTVPTDRPTISPVS
jgi:hypothetical protein